VTHPGKNQRGAFAAGGPYATKPTQEANAEIKEQEEEDIPCPTLLKPEVVPTEQGAVRYGSGVVRATRRNPGMGGTLKNASRGPLTSPPVGEHSPTTKRQRAVGRAIAFGGLGSPAAGTIDTSKVEGSALIVSVHLPDNALPKPPQNSIANSTRDSSAAGSRRESDGGGGGSVTGLDGDADWGAILSGKDDSSAQE